MDEGIGKVEEITDPILVEKLLTAQSIEEFHDYYEQYTGQELEWVATLDMDRPKDMIVWQHYWKLASAEKSPNWCITPEGYEIYIPS